MRTGKAGSAAASFAVFCLGLLIFALCSRQAHAATPSHPNVLIFLIDDLGRTDLRVDGSAFHDTPRLDALAQSGVRFTTFYANCPVCSPTRAALMTGTVPQRVGITDWIHPQSGVALPAEEMTLGEAFQSHGYQTAYVGKWHLGEADAVQPVQHGFQWTQAVNRAGQPATYYFPFRRAEGKSTIWDVPDLEDGARGEYLTDALTSCAIKFLQEHDAQRPFLLCIGHYAVHTPIEPPAELLEKYRARRTQLYGASETPTLAAPFDALSRARQDDASYAAMVENLDTNVGRVLDALDNLNLRDNTIVLFTSDNGGLCTLAGKRSGPTCNLPWRSGKGWLYEGGIRVPCFIAWPGHLQPATSDVPGYTADLYPTLLDLCGLPARPQQCLDGRSLTFALHGTADASLADRPLAWYYPHDHGSGHRAGAAIRQGSWKLVHYFADNRSELYNLVADPGESIDVSAQQPETARRLLESLQAWIKSTTR